ncbi:MAG: ArnT family glycosyltransferase [Steroidobacterales bacterium]
MSTAFSHSLQSLKPTTRDLVVLLGLALLMYAAGLGLRDPWPADEPRFALIAREMVQSGQWLFPVIGGEYYADKPPLYFWIMAAFYALTGSMRVAFLLPSLVAALASIVLIYDLARRLFNRDAAFGAALLLTFTFAFAWQARAAQIDMTVTAFILLSLYALLRHLLEKPDWRLYSLAGFAAGLGVITKGVGFLPFLALLPYLIMRWRGWKFPRIEPAGWRWALAPLAMLLAIALWLVPVLLRVSASGDPALIEYRDNILLQQTVTRYAESWHHVQPFYYYVVEVIPFLWLPLSMLLIWLVPRWRKALAAQDARVWLPLGWAILVVIFFSLSPGKRGVYIVPAIPAVVLAAAPHLKELWARRDVQLAGLVLTVAIGVLMGGAYLLATVWQPAKARELVESAGPIPWSALACVAIISLVAAIVCRRRAGLVALAFALGSIWLYLGWVIGPAMTGARSGADFVAQALAKAPAGHELGLVAYKEQFLLYLDRPVVNFGHRRWREGPQESYDAARWLDAAPNRALLVDEAQQAQCFLGAAWTVFAGTASDMRWSWVTGPADPKCAALGKGSAILYRPPRS